MSLPSQLILCVKENISEKLLFLCGLCCFLLSTRVRLCWGVRRQTQDCSLWSSQLQQQAAGTTRQFNKEQEEAGVADTQRRGY